MKRVAERPVWFIVGVIIIASVLVFGFLLLKSAREKTEISEEGIKGIVRSYEGSSQLIELCRIWTKIRPWDAEFFRDKLYRPLSGLIEAATGESIKSSKITGCIGDISELFTKCTSPADWSSEQGCADYKRFSLTSETVQRWENVCRLIVYVYEGCRSKYSTAGERERCFESFLTGKFREYVIDDLTQPDDCIIRDIKNLSESSLENLIG